MSIPKKGPKMTAKRRKKLPASKFGLPSQNKYPIDSKGRAVAAKGYAKKQKDRGNLSTSQYDQIVSRANKVLGTAHSSASKKRRKKS